jgi:hypothetical protein
MSGLSEIMNCLFCVRINETAIALAFFAGSSHKVSA